MSIVELSNTPITVVLNKKDYKIQRLSISELFVISQASVRREYFANVMEISKMLEGKEKQTYLDNAGKKAPKGEELQNMGVEYLDTTEGVSELLFIALNKFQKITKEEVIDIIIKDSASIGFVMSYIIGMEEKKSNDSSNDSDDKKK